LTEDDLNSLKPAASIKLAGLNDLVKLIASTMAERVSGYIGYYHSKTKKEGEKEKHVYFMFNTSLGYYNLRALPIVVWVASEEEPTGSFIRYRTSPKEELQFSDDISDAKWPISIPIVNFEEMPDFLRVWEE